MTPTPPAEVDVAEGRRLLEALNALRATLHATGLNIEAFEDARADWNNWLLSYAPALLTAAEQVAGLRETILSAANICEHWADESRNGGWSTHQVEPNRRLAASLRKAALGAAP